MVAAKIQRPCDFEHVDLSGAARITFSSQGSRKIAHITYHSQNVSSEKQYNQRSFGCAEAITGCPLACECLLACLFGELSQHNVAPHC
ncbi:MAG TPA: hypothetical protein VFP82_07665 [Chthoniobacterales bacterium]|nr:hypothetical protein [Chthoniobacterales bacterium]